MWITLINLLLCFWNEIVIRYSSLSLLSTIYQLQIRKTEGRENKKEIKVQLQPRHMVHMKIVEVTKQHSIFL